MLNLIGRTNSAVRFKCDSKSIVTPDFSQLPPSSCYRYATTLVTSEVHNPEPGAREIFMTVILPDTAFISRFAIEVSGQLFVAFVKEKEEAWREYQSAVEKGRTAGE